MNVQRQYSLPSCKLILEGLADVSAGATARPPVTTVSNVECYFSGHEKPLTGGREFLESLTAAVSDYAQAFLSGISHPTTHRDRQNRHRIVELERIDPNLHRLIVQPQAADRVASLTQPQQLDLSTVQLFDLVEAIDQFQADAQTLPDLTLNLQPLPKRYAVSQEPVGKRAAAPALGVSGLAIAALALFFVPAPEVQRPQSTSSGANSEASPSPSPSAVAGSSPTPVPVSPSPAAGTPDEQAAAALLNNSPEITDPAEQERLKTALYDKIDQSWKITPTFQTNLEYRVGVAANADLVGYSFINDEALQYKQEVPLLDLLRLPAVPPDANGATNPEAIAQFRVVFKPDGVLEVSPWYGDAAPAVSPSASPTALPSP